MSSSALASGNPCCGDRFAKAAPKAAAQTDGIPLFREEAVHGRYVDRCRCVQVHGLAEPLLRSVNRQSALLWGRVMAMSKWLFVKQAGSRAERRAIDRGALAGEQRHFIWTIPPVCGRKVTEER